MGLLFITYSRRLHALPSACGTRRLYFKREEVLNCLKCGAWCCCLCGEIILKWEFFEVCLGSSPLPRPAEVFKSLVLVTLHPTSTCRNLKGIFSTSVYHSLVGKGQRSKCPTEGKTLKAKASVCREWRPTGKLGAHCLERRGSENHVPVTVS